MSITLRSRNSWKRPVESSGSSTRSTGRSGRVSRRISGGCGGWGCQRRNALLGRARELDDLAGAEHAHLEWSAQRRAGQPVADRLDVVLRHTGHAVDGEDDVAAQGHLPPADGDDPVAPLQAHVPRQRTLGDRLDDEPGGRRDVEDRRMAAVTRSSCRSEISAAASDEMIFARTTSPATPSTVISSMPLTTCAAVITLPLLEIRTPEPVSLKRVTPPALTSRPLLRTTTTDGLTLRKISSRF